MIVTSILTIRVRRKKDALFARQRARQVAQLLHFDLREQACIAAGVFLIASQAIERLGEALLSFEINQNQLVVSALDTSESSASKSTCRAAADSATTSSQPLRLTKPLPHGLILDTTDLVWVLKVLEPKAPAMLFEELVKQNEDVLRLLYELQNALKNLEAKKEDPENKNAA